MSGRMVPIEETEPPESRFDSAIEWLLAALLAFLPLALGAVHAWSELAYVAAAGAIALCLALKLLVNRDVSFVWTWAYVPAALLLLIVALQLIPLPVGVVRALSPETAALKTRLLADTPGADTGTMALSFYPHATRHDLRLLLAAAAVFVAVLNVFRRPDQIKRLLAAVAIIGGGIALLALAQHLSGDGRIYWTIPTYGNAAASGPFVCHSHYGQFMNLSIGAALALLFVKLHESFGDGAPSLPDVAERLGSPELRVVWLLAAMAVGGAVTIFLSLTRGGMVSLAVAGGFTGLVAATRRGPSGRGWLLALLALAAFAAVLYLGFDAVYDRLATLRGLRGYAGRWSVVRNTAASFARFPLLGTGLGTHEVVYPMFERSLSPDPDVASHAENDYAQAAEETGLLGLGLVLAFLAFIWWAYARSVRRLGRPLPATGAPIRSAAFGLGFGLMAVLLHSFGDFGQRLPANHALSAVTCALLLAIARAGRKDSRSLFGEKDSRSLFRPALRAVPLLAIAGIWTWALLGAEAARRAQDHWFQALKLEAALAKAGWQGSNEDYAALIAHAEAAAKAEPGNVEYRHWLNVYRWRAISRVADPKTGEMLVTPRTVEFARRIVAELHKARALCPTFGATCSVAGQIERFVLGDPAGADRIRAGYMLAPCDPTACYLAGLVDALDGQHEASLEKFQRCLRATGGYFREMADLYLRQVKRPDLAVALAGDDVQRLLYVASALHEDPDNKELAAKARELIASARAP
ncbi:MAG: O-antigen ligase family protein, partial [Planctomycetes bacterium]|nr:O-antigen ligase family protein [Planctomycetota bacterium]